MQCSARWSGSVARYHASECHCTSKFGGPSQNRPSQVCQNRLTMYPAALGLNFTPKKKKSDGNGICTLKSIELWDNNLRFSPVSASLVQLLQHASGHGNHNIWGYSWPTPQMYVVATFMTQAPDISVHSLASNLFSALAGTTFIDMDIPDLWTAGTNDLDREPTTSKSHRIVYTLSLINDQVSYLL